MENEIVYVDDKAYEVKEIPEIINNTWKQLQNVKAQCDAAKEKAEKAKKDSENLVEVKWYNKKDAIIGVQHALKSNTEAIDSLADANKVSFEYQNALSQMTKMLFKLSVGTRAATRSVIREVRRLLENASAEELDALAEEELNRVLVELNAQEDLAKKQQRTFGLLKEQDDRLSAQENILSEQEYQLYEHEKKIKFVANQIKRVSEKEDENVKLIHKQSDRIDDNANRIQKGEKKDKQQDKIIEEQARKDLEHDRRLDEGDKKDSQQDKLIKTNSDEIARLESYIEKLEKRLDEQNSKLEYFMAMVAECKNHEKQLIKKNWSRK